MSPAPPVEDRNAVIRLRRAAGEKLHVIAADFAISRQRAHQIVHRVDRKKRPQPPPGNSRSERNQEIVRRRLLGDKLRELAADFGLSVSTVSTIVPRRQPGLRLVAWRPKRKAALRGFVTVELPLIGLVLDCAVLESAGRRWVHLPTKPRIEDGRHRRSARGPVISWQDQALRDALSARLVAAVVAEDPEAFDVTHGRAASQGGRI